MYPAAAAEVLGHRDRDGEVLILIMHAYCLLYALQLTLSGCCYA